MARRESFKKGNKSHSASDSCVRCGEGFNRKAGTQRVGGSLFDAHGEAVYHKNPDLLDYKTDRTIMPRGKYCPTCNTDYESRSDEQARIAERYEG